MNKDKKNEKRMKKEQIIQRDKYYGKIKGAVIHKENGETIYKTMDEIRAEVLAGLHDVKRNNERKK